MVRNDIQSISEGKIFDPEPINHYKNIKEQKQKYLDKLRNEEPKYSEDTILSNKDPYTIIKNKNQEYMDSLKNIGNYLKIDDSVCNELSNNVSIIGLKHYEGSELLTPKQIKKENKIVEKEYISPEDVVGTKYEMVDHPQHYGGGDNPYEAIKVIEAWNLNFNLGNVIKYISRAGLKNKNKLIEDLKKASWYLNREIENLIKRNDK